MSTSSQPSSLLHLFRNVSKMPDPFLKASFVGVLALLLAACHSDKEPPRNKPRQGQPYVLVLGIAQDAGYPQTGCQRACCQAYWQGHEKARKVVCLGIVDPLSRQKWMIEATPDFKEQVHTLHQELPDTDVLPEAIFLTHAHIGHYSGLMQLGREVMGTHKQAVWVMPRMKRFLFMNGPWNLLLNIDNIALHDLVADSSLALSKQLSIRPILVPHRGEYSETVGYQIRGPQKSLLFIPDIDKWEKWDRSLIAVLREVDYALVDGTFYQNGELPGRDMSEIPHPFVEESMELLAGLPAVERRKLIFIHFNHTNPLLRHSPERQEVKKRGFGAAEEGMKLGL